MAKINILPARVYNRIAAGEVVDRPYSVVKELVENSIDAGATEIEIYIESGGKQFIRVVDNGCGIERDDLQSAFLPHATSKISQAEDLENIMTLGFRGEAIASIASVSKMSITSMVEGEKCYRLSSVGGELGNIKEVAGEKGTDVRVEFLFYNAPVRLNFLKSDKAEEADITTFVSRFILNRPEIAFTYYANGKKILQSFGGGDEEAFVCVYGAAARSQCIQIDAERHGIRVKGFIGNPNFYKANKSYQSVFLNGRYVLQATIAAAVSGAYSNYLMKRQYPFYVLHITVPPQIVDVNVHPNKADVRFADNKIIYGCVYQIISDVLDGNVKALDYVIPNPQVEMEEKTNETPQQNKPVQSSISDAILAMQEEKPTRETGYTPPVFEKEEKEENTFGFATLSYEEAQRQIKMCEPYFKKTAPTKKEKPKEPIPGVIPYDQIGDWDKSDAIYVRDGEVYGRKKKANPEKLLKLFPGLPFKRSTIRFKDSASERLQKECKEQPEVDYFAENKRYLEELDNKAKQNKIDVQSCQYVGKAFNTYLIYEYGDKLLLIDQHAAHERLIFDCLKEKMRNRTIVRQPMLLPYTFQTNPAEGAFLRDCLNEIADIGFDIVEEEENQFSVTSIPADLPKIQLETFFQHILNDLDGYRAIKIEDVLKDKLASAACKAAIKGGMDISQEEIKELLRQMDGDMSLKCPHGRPVVVELTKTQMEKMFKRII